MYLNLIRPAMIDEFAARRTQRLHGVPTSMRTLKIYKFSLLLPLVVSGVLVPLFYVDLRLPEWLKTLIYTTAASGLVAGLPYLVLVALLLLWGRGKTENQFRLALMLSPLLLLPIFFLFIVIFALIVDRQSFGWQTIDGMFFYVLFILGYGYAYVGVGLASVFILRRLGLITASNAI